MPPQPALAIDQIHLRLFAARCTTIDARRWTLRRMQDSFWRLYRNDAPGAALEVEAAGAPARRVELAPGRLYFVPAGVRFSTGVTAPLRHLYVHHDVLGIPQAALQALFDGPLEVPSAPQLEREAAELANVLADEDRPALLTQCRVKALLYGALAAHLAQLPPALHDRYQQLIRAQEPLQPALQAIDARLAERLSNCELARLCHISEDYFIRLFRAGLGQSPTQYIQAQRVRRAAQRLLFSADSIESIAAESGFGNRYYFTRVFARHLGLAPAAYRRQARA